MGKENGWRSGQRQADERERGARGGADVRWYTYTRRRETRVVKGGGGSARFPGWRKINLHTPIIDTVQFVIDCVYRFFTAILKIEEMKSHSKDGGSFSTFVPSYGYHSLHLLRQTTYLLK